MELLNYNFLYYKIEIKQPHKQIGVEILASIRPLNLKFLAKNFTTSTSSLFLASSKIKRKVNICGWQTAFVRASHKG